MHDWEKKETKSRRARARKSSRQTVSTGTVPRREFGLPLEVEVTFANPLVIQSGGTVMVPSRGTFGVPEGELSGINSLLDKLDADHVGFGARLSALEGVVSSLTSYTPPRSASTVTRSSSTVTGALGGHSPETY